MIGSASCEFPNYNWAPDSLIGLTQTGNTITIVSFTYGGTDYSTSRDLITYTQ